MIINAIFVLEAKTKFVLETKSNIYFETNNLLKCDIYYGTERVSLLIVKRTRYPGLFLILIILDCWWRVWVFEMI